MKNYNRNNFKLSFKKNRTQFFVNEKKGTVSCIVTAHLVCPHSWYSPVVIDGGEINGTRGIKADNEYSTASLENTVLVVEGTKFATTSSKPAILVKMINAEITVSNADIANVAADSVNPVWIDEDCPTTGTIKVTVDGAVKDNASINEKVLG